MSTKVSGLVYARVQVPDLENARRFFADFGLIESAVTEGRVYLRGLGPSRQILIVQQGPRKLISTAFAVESRDALEHFSGAAGASAVTPRNEPGGGWQLQLPDLDGNTIELVAEVQAVAEIAARRAPMNSGVEPARRIDAAVRPPIRPSHVMRLGHVVVTTPQPDRLAQWYRDTLGLLLSDEIYGENDDELLLSFSRIDRGAEYVDHHVFQTMAGPAGGVHHISFEVLDLDDLFIGHDCLVRAGHRHIWGIGRHKQGSQIFDYWLDPAGIMYEHWTDSDQLNAVSKPGRDTVANALGPWGPALPAEFLTQVG